MSASALRPALLLAFLVLQVQHCCSEQGSFLTCQSPAVRAVSRVWFHESTAAPQLTPGQWPPGTEARYSCDPGYLLLGDESRTCLPTGHWTGAAPHCLLNVAEQSSLAAEHPVVVDGYLTTHLELQQLFSSGRTLQVDLYAEFELLEVRFITYYDLTGYHLWIGQTGGPGPIAFTLESPRPLPASEVANRWLHTVSLKNAPLPRRWRALTVNLLDAEDQSLDRHQDGGGRLYELQIIANSTGLSWRQCLDDVGRSDVLETWADQHLCYHLVDARETQMAAQRSCLALGSQGDLFEAVSGGSYDMMLDRVGRYTPPNNFWISDRPQDPDPSPPSPGRSALDQNCRVLRRWGSSWQLKLSSCSATHRFICQREPRVCGSPPRQPSLSYSPLSGPVSAPSAAALNGTVLRVSAPCPDGVATDGEILCTPPHWQWSRRPQCRPALTTGKNATSSPGKTPKKIDPVGAIAGAAAGALVLLVAAVALAWSARRRRAAKRPTQQIDYLEFMGLNPNPMYAQTDQQNAYSELEAIYEEPSFTGSCMLTIREEPRPPPVPTTRPSVSGSESEPLKTETGHPGARAEAIYNLYDTAEVPLESRHRNGDAVQHKAEYSVPLDGKEGSGDDGKQSRRSRDGGKIGTGINKLPAASEYSTPYNDSSVPK